MRKYLIGAVTGVRVSYYYNRLLPNGTWENWNHSFDGTSGPVAQRYLDDASRKADQLKPWTTQWESLGYPLIHTHVEDIPDAYPARDSYPLVVEKDPSIKNREFRRRQREGEILVSNFKKQTFDVKYTRGIVVDDNVLRSLGYKTGRNPDVVKEGDTFVQDGRTIRIVGSPYLRYLYDLVEARTEVHPFDVGWIRHTALLPPFEVNTRVVTSTLSDAESGTLDLLTEVMELPETVSFLASVIKSGTQKIETHRREIKQYMKLLKTATGKFAEKISKKLASSWLAFRYAIMPIFYSIEDIKKTLQEYKRLFAKFTGKESRSMDIPKDGFEQVSFASITDRCWIKRSYSPEDLIDQLLGVLKVNPLSTAWELVTLSFVVDWFLNIGDVITAFSGDKVYCGQGATTSRKIEGVATYQSTQVPSCRVDVYYASYDRHVIEPRDHIGLSFRFDMNWKRWLDSIALLLQPSIDTLKRIKRHG